MNVEQTNIDASTMPTKTIPRVGLRLRWKVKEAMIKIKSLAQRMAILQK